MKLPENNADVENHLIQIAKAYATAMNELENQMMALQKNDQAGTIDYFAVYRKAYDPVFQQYATDKRRVYGGKATSYGYPPKYDGITAETAGQVNFKSKRKAEVYFKTANNFDAEYLFVLHKEGDDWKIDNVKYKWYNNEKWSSLIM
ncbi:RhsIA family immunity protein [Chitinophaga nivalis]|uniref:RhsIA family immunity protein n=1 Tax=Chitinophaga nivalis TaxID=2991709 RepID=A0ABT3ITJ2_9BACT|nr:RhsIA family immunity protein [Chitinophaga nivalis]MCW3463020.1 RhsIA family immunity protein [Chitinophaga nivalis]MCW3487290.1 RhsIA family immunity protein [Chitinophaga nivalis]